MSESVQIAGIDKESIVNGPGIRFTVFFQGCFRHCKGCHNRDTWSPIGGRSTTVDAIIAEMESDPLITGLSLSGGEPFLQIDAASELADYAHGRGWTVWCWTGYKLEDLKGSPRHESLLNKIDVLIDGEYVEELRSLDLPWRGSSNQRVIDMHKVVK